MIIHFSILGVIFVVSMLYDRKSTRNKLKNKDYVMPIMPWLLIFGYIAFLAGMRSGMNDTSVYIQSFKATPGTFNAISHALKDTDIKYAFFSVLANLFKMFVSDNFHVWFLFLAAIQSICFIYVFRRECYGILIPCFYFFASSLYYNYFSMLRQWMAVTIIFGGFELLKEKKWGKYILVCLLGAAFHPSALVCIVFAFLAMGKPWQRKQSFILLVASIFIVSLNPILSNIDVENSTYGYAIEAMQSSSGSSPIRVAVAAVPVLIALYFRKPIDADNNEAINICINMSVLSFLLNAIATFTSGLYIVRLATYLAPYTVILYSYLLTKVVKARSRKVIVVAFFAVYLIYYCYSMDHMGSWGYKSDIIGTFSY